MECLIVWYPAAYRMVRCQSKRRIVCSLEERQDALVFACNCCHHDRCLGPKLTLLASELPSCKGGF